MNGNWTNTAEAVSAEAILDTRARLLDRANIRQLLRGAGRRLKPVVATTILCAGAFGILSEQSSISANSAVVSARVVSVRAPIEGFFSAAILQVNQPVERGALLGEIHNNHFDPAAQQSYQLQGTEASGQAHAIAAEQNQLLQQRANLMRRVQNHTNALSDRIDRQIAQGERVLDARQASFRLASADLERGRQLYTAGILSRAALDKLNADAAVAQSESQAQEADLSTTQSVNSAVRKGMMIEIGSNNDVAYSEQRIDDINLRLADLQRERLTLEADAAAARSGYAQALTHAEAMDSARMTAPASGIVWKWFAADGERLGSGDKVAELVDCRSAFLLASLPQDRVPAIRIGATAQYRLSGENADHRAHVASINAELPTTEGNKLAAEPIKVDERPAVLIRLNLDPQDVPRGCLVGRTASVVIRAHEQQRLATLFHHYF